MFNLGDQTYQGRPAIMSNEVVEASARRLSDYARQAGLKNINVALHGGEPLLAGKEKIQFLVNTFRKMFASDIECEFSLQTNGVLIDDDWVSLLGGLDVKTAVSLDGTAAVHDSKRKNHAGHGSHDQVVQGIRRLQAWTNPAPIFGGVLCVINPEVSGTEIYEHFLSLGIQWMDFLLPDDYNWDRPPAAYRSPTATPFADYLLPIFHRWWQADDPGIQIRMFTQLISLVLGGKSSVDSIGGCPLSEAVIDTDGSLEPLDVFRACGNGFTQTGLNILKDPIAALSETALFRKGMAGLEGLCSNCNSCSLGHICGSGYMPHRYSQENGFDNPSVYCRDLWKLISHIVLAMKESVSHSGMTHAMFTAGSC